MLPILLCWPTTSEADVGDMAVEDEPSRQYSVEFCCRATDNSRGTVWQNGVWRGSAYEAKVCNGIPPWGKNRTQWNSSTLAKRLRRPNSGCQHSEAVGGPFTMATATWKTSHVPDGHAQLSHHEMMNISISSSARIGGLRLGNCVRSWISASMRYFVFVLFVSIVVSMEINRRHYFRIDPGML
jgi:hypothetical protein